MKAKQPAVEAIRLLGRWQRLAGGHVVFGAGCSCGAVGTSVRVQDFEQDILGFLQGRHGEPARAPTILELLTRLGRGKHDPEKMRALLEDLERSIDSFDEMHRGGRS
jgi:hypothetical protein